jgi:hypothetical protein
MAAGVTYHGLVVLVALKDEIKQKLLRAGYFVVYSKQSRKDWTEWVFLLSEVDETPYPMAEILKIQRLLWIEGYVTKIVTMKLDE